MSAKVSSFFSKESLPVLPPVPFPVELFPEAEYRIFSVCPKRDFACSISCSYVSRARLAADICLVMVVPKTLVVIVFPSELVILLPNFFIIFCASSGISSPARTAVRICAHAFPASWAVILLLPEPMPE